MGIGLPVAKFLDISPSPPAPLPVGEGREPANPLPSQREMALPVGEGDPPDPTEHVYKRRGRSRNRKAARRRTLAAWAGAPHVPSSNDPDPRDRTPRPAVFARWAHIEHHDPDR